MRDDQSSNNISISMINCSSHLYIYYIQVRELRWLLDERPQEGVERLDSYAVHVRASVLKSFFRELPEPLLTFDLYDDFILAAEISDPQVIFWHLLAIEGSHAPESKWYICPLQHVARSILRLVRSKLLSFALCSSPKRSQSTSSKYCQQ